MPGAARFPTVCLGFLRAIGAPVNDGCRPSLYAKRLQCVPRERLRSSYGSVASSIHIVVDRVVLGVQLVCSLFIPYAYRLHWTFLLCYVFSSFTFVFTYAILIMMYRVGSNNTECDVDLGSGVGKCSMSLVRPLNMSTDTSRHSSARA